MFFKHSLLGAACILALAAPAIAAGGPTDPQIAHIAYTAGNLDVDAGKQALARPTTRTVRSFAQQMIRDHQAVNAKALALVKKLHVTPRSNPTSKALTEAADANPREAEPLRGAAFDRAYIDNEVAYHKTVNGALEIDPDSQRKQWRIEVAPRDRADAVPRASGARRTCRQGAEISCARGFNLRRGRAGRPLFSSPAGAAPHTFTIVVDKMKFGPASRRTGKR